VSVLRDLDNPLPYRIHQMAGVSPRQFKRSTACCSGEWNRRDAQGNLALRKYLQDPMLELLIADRRKIVEAKAD